MKNKPIALVALALLACSHANDGSDKAPAASSAVTTSAGTGAALSMQSAPSPAYTPSPKDKDRDEDEFPFNAPEKFSDGERSFDRVRDAVLKDYYLTGITEDEIYRAAAQGILEHVDPKMHKWNKLISPAEVAQIRNDLKGEIVGIGVKIIYEAATGHVEITGIVPGSPAEKSGLLVGDLIVSVNGKTYKGMSEREVVADIRGKIGEKVTLSVLREDKLIPFGITREVITIDEVTHRVFGDGVGYVQIHGFSSKTLPMLIPAMEDLATKSLKGIIVDLRANQGGAFDGAVASAEQFLPAGAPIVTLKKRDGKEETIVSKGSPLMANLPVAVLVGRDTSSGAEFLTAALQEGRHARVIGARTYGKWSVQVLNDLPNGYAFKFTTSLFFAPSGKTFDGVGLIPDVAVDAPEEQIEKSWLLTDGDKRLAADAQLRTAVSILTVRP